MWSFSVFSVVLLLAIGLSLGQRRSLWKRYVNLPGTLNCQQDAEALYRLTSVARERYCVARIANSSAIYPGALIGIGISIRFYGTRPTGSWFIQDTLDEVEVLDVDARLMSWIPIALNPPESVLVQPESPFSSDPKRFICRPLPHVISDTVVQNIGVVRGRVCHTYGWKDSYESNFEILALNERAKMFYDFGYSSQFLKSSTNVTA